jgi:hypothetical protein
MLERFAVGALRAIAMRGIGPGEGYAQRAPVHHGGSGSCDMRLRYGR